MLKRMLVKGIGFAILLGAFAVYLGSLGFFQTAAPPTAIDVEPPTEAAQNQYPQISFDNVTLSNQQHHHSITAVAVNQEQVPHSFIYEVVFYNARGDRLGVLSDHISRLEGFGRHPISLEDDHFPNAVSVKIRVTRLVD